MIVEVTKNSLKELEDSFLSIDEISHEFESNPFARLIILKEENEVIGYIYYSEIYERLEINQFEINFIHRNCGKGNQLLKAFLEENNKDITLEVRENNLPAIHLYEKYGFEKKAIRPGYYNGIDGILMERKRKDSSK